MSITARRPASADTPDPIAVDLAAGKPLELAWYNEIGGVTWRIGGGESYVKVGPPHEEFQPAAESERLEWLAARGIAVPRVLDLGECDGRTWMHTVGLPGTNAIECQDDPVATVAALGRGLRRFHDALPVEECPFTFSVESRVRRRGLTDFDDVPPLDLVVCHGDACNPNFLVEWVTSPSTPSPRSSARGTQDPREERVEGALEVTGYVDLGLCGVADRWADLVMAVGSLAWNFPGVDGRVLLDAYGVEQAPEKFAFYDALWRAD